MNYIGMPQTPPPSEHAEEAILEGLGEEDEEKEGEGGDASKPATPKEGTNFCIRLSLVRYHTMPRPLGSHKM